MTVIPSLDECNAMRLVAILDARSMSGLTSGLPDMSASIPPDEPAAAAKYSAERLHASPMYRNRPRSRTPIRVHLRPQRKF